MRKNLGQIKSLFRKTASRIARPAKRRDLARSGLSSGTGRLRAQGSESQDHWAAADVDESSEGSRIGRTSAKDLGPLQQKKQKQMVRSVSRRAGYAVLGLVSAGLLTGCVETAALSPPQAEAQQSPPHRQGASPHGASVALVSLTGVSGPVGERFKSAFMQSAVQNQMTIAESKAANYLVRGYLNPHPAETGAAIDIVFDIFDSSKRRAHRLDDTVVVKGATVGSEAIIDDNVIRQVAAKSAADIAGFLANTPEALAEVKTTPGAASTKTAARPSVSGQTIARRTQPMPRAPVAEANGLGMAALR